MSPANPWSLETRLRRELLLPLLALWLGGSAVAVLGVWIEIGAVLDSSLEESAQRMLAVPTDANGKTVDEESEDSEAVRFQVLDHDGRMLWRSRDAPTEPLTDRHKPGLRTEAGNRVAVEISADGSRTAIATETLKHRSQALWSLARWLLVPLLLLLPAAAWVIGRVLRRGFAALDTLRPALAQPTLNQPLRPLSVQALPQELYPLIATLNGLLERINGMVAAEKAFAANSAHELRTPLAAARAQCQRLLSEVPPNGPAHERASALLRRLDQLGDVSAKLLQLSRVESGLGLAREPVDLENLIKMVAGDFSAPAQAARLRIDVPDEAVWVLGDLDALGIALRNLLENALRHSGSGTVTVRARPDGRLDVEDDGAGVAPDVLLRLKQPFQRASAAEGMGLGLAIADSVAKQVGGSLELHSPVRDGRGFCASLHLRPCTAPSEFSSK